MLEKDMLYVRNDGQVVRIYGPTEYVHEPWVCSCEGDWYDKNTGGLVYYDRAGQFVTLPVMAEKSISNHRVRTWEDICAEAEGKH